MSALLIDDTGRKRIQALVDFASQPENYYRPAPKAKISGDDSRYVIILGTYRCVFSHTKMPDERLYRHLSVSVLRKGRYPLPEGVEMLGVLFGFEGSFASWDKNIDKNTQSIGVAQQIFM